MANKPKLNYAAKPEEQNKRDLFLTPSGATKLILPFIPSNITTIWEPACATGKMVNVFKAAGYDVIASDLVSDGISIENNFLTDIPNILYRSDAWDQKKVAIISNPAYSCKKFFYERCLELELPFSLLIPADICQWVADGFSKYSMTAITPRSRINYITPSGRQGKESAAQFHSWFFTRWFTNKNQIEVVEYTKEMKEDI